MLEELDCSIAQLKSIQNKGPNMTLAEKKYMENTIELFKLCEQLIRDGKRFELTAKHMLFIENNLPELIRTNDPKIGEICEIHGIKLDDRIYGVESDYNTCYAENMNSLWYSGNDF